MGLIEDRVRSLAFAMSVRIGDGARSMPFTHVQRLSGPILADEVPRLWRRVRRVRGVQSIDDRLEIHDSPGAVPGLQSGATFLVPGPTPHERLRSPARWSTPR
jgi:hypothetical protein